MPFFELVAVLHRAHQTVDLPGAHRRGLLHGVADRDQRMASGPQPSAAPMRFTSHSVSEPVVLMASSLPFKSATVLIGKSAPTVTPILRGSLAKDSDRDDRRAFHREGHRRAAAEAEFEGCSKAAPAAAWRRR